MLKDILYAVGLNKVRWDKAFPNARAGDEPTPGIKRVADEGPCEICGRPTSWRNTVTETWVCSLRCRMTALRALREKPARILEEELQRIRGDAVTSGNRLRRPMKQLPRAWMGVLYALAVWLPVLGALYENVRDAVLGRWAASDWVIMLLFWGIGSFLWMSLCDWTLHRIGVWRGWWQKETR